jgi:hypothetical protein
VIGRAADGQILHAWRSGGVWSHEAVVAMTPSGVSFAQKTLGTPAAALAADGTIHVFYREFTALEWLKLSGRAWSTASLDNAGIFVDADARAVTSQGKIEIFAVDTTSRLLRITLGAGAPSITRSEMGRVYGRPGVIASPSGRLDVLARGADGLLWHKTFQGGESPWVARDEKGFAIKNASTGLCLQAARSTPNGAYDAVVMAACSGADTQRWYRRPSLDSGSRGTWAIRGVDGQCLSLDVPNGPSNDGSKIALRGCAEDLDQHFNTEVTWLRTPNERLNVLNYCAGAAAAGTTPTMTTCGDDGRTTWRLVD